MKADRAEATLHETGAFWFIEANRGVGFTHVEIEDAVIDENGELNLRIFFTERGEPRRKPRRGDEFGNGDGDGAFGQALRVAELRLDLSEAGENVFSGVLKNE